jgi:hypothetical protein
MNFFDDKTKIKNETQCDAIRWEAYTKFGAIKDKGDSMQNALKHIQAKGLISGYCIIDRTTTDIAEKQMKESLSM